MTETARQNRLALILTDIAVVLMLLLCTMPLYFFDATVYTKRSANTFVGDEKYAEALAEVEAVAEDFRAQGMEAEIKETVTERTTSKGEKTSLVVFTLEQTISKNLFSFLGASFSSAHILRILLALILIGAVTALAGTLKSFGAMQRDVPERDRRLRTVMPYAALIATLLVPAFVMANNVIFSRRLSLYNGGQLTEGKEEFFASLGRFLLGTEENAEAALSGLSFTKSGLVWLLIPCYIIVLIAGLMLRYGQIKHTLLKMLLILFVVAVCIITLYPYYVMLITAFRSNQETTDMYFLHMLPTEWKWQNLTDIIRRGVPRYLLNSVMVAGGATAISMLCGIPAAYAMARMDFKGKKAFLGFVIMSQMFSPVVLLIGIAQLMSTLHLNDSVVGLMLINAAFNQAFAIWLLRGTFVAISPEMEQAAMIDGCGTMGALTKVLLPVSAPGIVTALIFVFINAWNEYTISTVLISTASNRPITVGITQFSSFNMIEWQYLFAASLLATVPVVILFMAIEKHLTAGLTSGGVKG